MSPRLRERILDRVMDHLCISGLISSLDELLVCGIICQLVGCLDANRPAMIGDATLLQKKSPFVQWILLWTMHIYSYTYIFIHNTYTIQYMPKLGTTGMQHMLLNNTIQYMPKLGTTGMQHMLLNKTILGGLQVFLFIRRCIWVISRTKGKFVRDNNFPYLPLVKPLHGLYKKRLCYKTILQVNT